MDPNLGYPFCAETDQPQILGFGVLGAPGRSPVARHFWVLVNRSAGRAFSLKVKASKVKAGLGGDQGLPGFMRPLATGHQLVSQFTIAAGLLWVVVRGVNSK